MARPARTGSSVPETASTPDSEAGGLRERKKRATRQALQHAAVQLFREHGPDSVTVDDICTHAEVSPRTFFNYFTSKEEVLVPWDRETVSRTAARIPDRPADEPPLEAAHSVLSQAIDTAMAGPTWRDQALVLREHPKLIKRILTASRAMESSLVDGLVVRTERTPGDAYVRLVAATAITALRVSIQAWQEDESAASLHDYVDNAFARLRQGLQPDDTD